MAAASRSVTVQHLRDSLVMCFALLLFGLFLLWFSANMGWKIHVLDKRGQSTMSHVQQVYQSTGSHSHQQISLTFAVEDHVEKGSVRDLSSSHKPGDTIEVVYDPQKPSRFMQRQELELPKSRHEPFYLFPLGLLFSSMGAYGLFDRWRKGPSQSMPSFKRDMP